MPEQLADRRGARRCPRSPPLASRRSRPRTCRRCSAARSHRDRRGAPRSPSSVRAALDPQPHDGMRVDDHAAASDSPTVSSSPPSDPTLGLAIVVDERGPSEERVRSATTTDAMISVTAKSRYAVVGMAELARNSGEPGSDRDGRRASRHPRPVPRAALLDPPPRRPARLASAASRAATGSPATPSRSPSSRSSRRSTAGSARRAARPAASGPTASTPSAASSSARRSPTSPAARRPRPAAACTSFKRR